MSPKSRWQVYLEVEARSERAEMLPNLSRLYGVSNEEKCGVRVKCLSLTIQVTLKVVATRTADIVTQYRAYLPSLLLPVAVFLSG